MGSALSCVGTDLDNGLLYLNDSQKLSGLHLSVHNFVPPLEEEAKFMNCLELNAIALSHFFELGDYCSNEAGLFAIIIGVICVFFQAQENKKDNNASCEKRQRKAAKV